jgi:hypothetical protein
MELDILKHFIDMDVEILVGGVWIDGHLMPIAKSVVVLRPIGEAIAFYGPASMKADVIQAIRQIKKTPAVNSQVTNPPANASKIKSGLENNPNAPGRFVVSK